MLIGRYEVIERIAVGGMAEIFSARLRGEEGFSREVILKRILPGLSDDPHFVDSFLNEARLCSTLHHPHIVQVYELGKVAGQYFIAMEYVRGGDLSSCLSALRAAGEPMPLEAALRIGIDMLDALDFAHAACDRDGQLLGVVHRDVTPSNVLLSVTGDAKVSDFGIAKATRVAGQTKTTTGVVKGKFTHMAPEQIRSEALDGRTDIFAAGIVLYQMLTGENPFRMDSEYETMNRILTFEPPPPSAVRSGLPIELDALVQRAMRKPIDERFSTAGELARALERVGVAHALVISQSAVANVVRRLPARPKSAPELVSETQEEESRTREYPPPASASQSANAAVARKVSRRAIVGAGAFALLVALLVLALLVASPWSRAPSAPPVSLVVEHRAASLPAEPASVPAKSGAVEPVLQTRPHPNKRPLAKKIEAPPVAPISEKVASGRLQIVVRPWARVTVDGHFVGETPFAPIELEAGRHVVTFENPDLKVSFVREVVIGPGESKTLNERLNAVR